MASPRYDKPKTNVSEPVRWWELLWESVTLELLGYLVIQFVMIPFAMFKLVTAGEMWRATGLLVLWLPTITWLIRDLLKMTFSRPSWFFVAAWVTVLVGWLAYEKLV